NPKVIRYLGREALDPELKARVQAEPEPEIAAPQLGEQVLEEVKDVPPVDGQEIEVVEDVTDLAKKAKAKIKGKIDVPVEDEDESADEIVDEDVLEEDHGDDKSGDDKSQEE
nr:hypothetical protein [Candidatus Sigynarchaeota archaeon]